MKAVNLSKQFPGKLAVSGLNFELLPGRLTALLGPNGAGKTTTMRLLSGYSRATSGYIKIQGQELRDFPVEIREKIGYLPENGPTYKDLTVKENLDFYAQIRCIPKSLRERAIFRVMDELNLGNSRNMVIGTLSKGFKQRVALASVLIGEPQYLILDEPSYGLDPNQMTQIRQLIKTLSRERTVLISTHSLDEVEEICEDVIILSQGKMVANNSVHNLRLLDKIFVQVQMDEPKFSQLMSDSGIGKFSFIKKLESNFYEYEISLEDKKPEDLYFIFSEKKIPLRELRRSEASLKTIFNSITGN